MHFEEPIAKTIRHVVKVHPFVLQNDDAKTVIFNIMKQKTLINKKHGYLREMLKVKDILSSVIDANGHIHFDALLDVVCIKPMLNKVYVCKIEFVYEQAIFLNFQNMFRIMITPDNNRRYNVDDLIRVKITMIEFNTEFQCIGEEIIT